MEKFRKNRGKRLEKSGKEKKRKKKQSEIRLFTSTIQMSLDSPLSWTLIAVQKKGNLTTGLTAGLSAGLTAVLTGIIVVILGLTAGLTAGLTGIIVVILGVPY